jgi:hypothetical protein
MPARGTRKCRNCGTFFKPDPRSKGRQKYCSTLSCQKASKAARQKKWLSQPQNQNYFKGPENIERVRRWRAKNPGYWIKPKKASHIEDTLQDVIMMQATDIKQENSELKATALQDALLSQTPVLIGLIAHLTGSALQDDIVNTTLKLQQLGEDFLHPPQFKQGESDEKLCTAQPGTLPGNSQTVQLGRSPPGT